MKKFLAIVFLFVIIGSYVKAQESSVIGYWRIIKMTTSDNAPDGMEFTVPFLEKYILKISPDTIKEKLKNNPDILTEAAKELLKEFEDMYMQFNPDGTYTASYKKGDDTKGKYSINRKKNIIKMDNENMSYVFKNSILTLTSQNGDMEVVLMKNASDISK